MSNSVRGCDHMEGSTSKKRSREGKSEVWIHFDKTPDNKKAICKYCGRSMVAESTKGTSHLKRHIKVCKKRQQDVDQPVTMGIRDEVRKFGCTNERNWEVEVMKAAIIAEVPFAPSDCKKVYSRLIMGSIDLDKEFGLYYEQEKEKLANEFKHFTSRVCFSYEIMKELKPINYISIRAHFINEDFNLVNKLIGFKKSTDISESRVVHTIVKCISDWELGDKIFSFTRKDHSQYVRRLKGDFSPIMSLDGPYFHLPCYKNELTSSSSALFRYLFAVESDDIWALIKSMKEDCIKEISKERGTFNKIAKERGLPPINEMGTFNKIAKERALPPINEDWLNQYSVNSRNWACPDPGRWEHTIKMFKQAILYKDVIGYCSKGHNIDWERVEVVVNLSDKVPGIIDTMASFNYPTFNLYFRNHAEIEDILSKKEGYADLPDYWHGPFWNSKTYRKENRIMVVACALDPRYKLRFLNYYLQKKEKQIVDEFTKEDTNEICEFLEKFFGEYKAITTEIANPQEGCTSNSAHLNPIIDRFSMYKKKLKKTAPKSELEEYLDVEESVHLDDGSFNLLGWWKHNRLRYPVLSKMARDVLAVPTSVYSIKNMISDLRVFEGVSPQFAEAVICSKDWITTDVQSVPESNN